MADRKIDKLKDGGDDGNGGGSHDELKRFRKWSRRIIEFSQIVGIGTLVIGVTWLSVEVVHPWMKTTFPIRDTIECRGYNLKIHVHGGNETLITGQEVSCNFENGGRPAPPSPRQ